jgi:signal transduction histidine kinase
VGTDSGGLNRVKHQVFSVVPISAGQVVKSVAEDRKGGVWIACNWQGGGVSIENYGLEVTRSYTNVHGLLNDVRAVYQDRNDGVWAGTFGGGLLRLQNQLWLAAPGSGAISRDREIPAFFEDSRSRLWVGFSGGVAMWERDQCRVFGPQEGLLPGTVRALAEDKEGNLWVGTENGLNQFQSDAFTRYGKTNGLPSDSISSLLVDADGLLWVGTQSGLARREGGRWVSYGSAFGQALGNVAYLLEDGLGDLWIGSNTGLLRTKRSALNAFAKGETEVVPFRSFGAADGLPTRECSQGSQPSACRTADGTLWFATVRGLAHVQPSQVVLNTNPPPVIIESISVDGTLQHSKTLRAPIPESLVIPAGKESLEIRYTALNLSAPDKSRFRYRLEGHETKWTEVSGEVRVVHYSKLPPKDYRFRVLAANEDNVWNEVGSTLAIRVLPPFWQTWWFLTALTLVLLGMIIGSVHYVSTQKLQRQLATMRQQETLEKERARIARDLHDQLGANLTQVALLGELAEDDREEPEEVAAHAQQICQTARETTRALDEIVWTVNPSNDTLDGLLNYVCKYAQEYLALAGLKYRLETPPELPNTPISPELRHNVFLAAKEAVNNVVKHSGADSAWIRLKLAPDRFVLEIEDNGKGLCAADQDKGRNGLRNMRKRMEDVGGDFDFAPGAAGGTRITLQAPIRRGPPTES